MSPFLFADFCDWLLWMVEALMNVTLAAHDEIECPLCKADVPINVKVGKGADYLKKKTEKASWN